MNRTGAPEALSPESTEEAVRSTRRSVIVRLAAAAAGCGVAGIAGADEATSAAEGAQAAQGAGSQGAGAAAAKYGSLVPVVVDAAGGLTVHTDQDNESWYVTAFVSDGKRKYSFLLHHLCLGTPTQGVTSSSVSLTADGLYRRGEALLPNRGGLSGAPGVDIHTDVMSWTGNAAEMKVHAKVANGELDVTLRPDGRVLYNVGTGGFNMFGDPAYLNYEYAFPSVATVGTLTLDGHTADIKGSAWIDRQWGALPPQSAGPHGWTWMNLILSNGVVISVWDTTFRSRIRWATILGPDGIHSVAEASISHDPDTLWTSPETGHRYASRWSVVIPSLQARFDVIAVQKNQELMKPGPRYEGSSRVTGRYLGKSVTGHCYVEASALS